ncbi:MAG: glycosyl hydrolase [bacterium]|nr:glycosyl hydrolase [bacterium]
MQRRKKVRTKMVVTGLVSLLLLAATVLGATQIGVVREFFSFASNPEPANITVDAQAILGPLPRPWRNLAQGGEESAWEIEPIAAQVKQLRPEYIRIDHIYDFYEIAQGSPGNITFNFAKFDKILDGITATGAKPYIALSYMPPALGGSDIVSSPARYADWQLVVQKTIEHVSGTKGIRDVYYEVWNEPDLFGGWKYYGDKSYLTLYDASARGARQARGVQPFKIGGPATTGFYKNWFDALAEHAMKNNLQLDFISWHRYDTDVEQFKQDILDIRTWAEKYPQLTPTLEFHITEWGHDSENDPGYDNNYGAAHTVAAAIEMVGVVERAFVFEIQDGKDPKGAENWGRWGLLTHQSFGSKPKPRYHALRMLDSLGEQRLQLLGKGTFVKALASKSIDGVYNVVLSNFDPRGRNAESVPVAFFNLAPGTYTLKREYISKAAASETVVVGAEPLQTVVSLAPFDVAKITLTQVN